MKTSQGSRSPARVGKTEFILPATGELVCAATRNEAIEALASGSNYTDDELSLVTTVEEYRRMTRGPNT